MPSASITTSPDCTHVYGLHSPQPYKPVRWHAVPAVVEALRTPDLVRSIVIVFLAPWTCSLKLFLYQTGQT